MEYKIINTVSLESLEDMINSILSEGGKLVGGVSINTQAGEGFFFQAVMVPEGVLDSGAAGGGAARKSKKLRKTRKF